MDSVCDLFTVNKQQAAVKKIVTELANDLFRKLKFFDRFTSFWPKFMPHSLYLDNAIFKLSKIKRGQSLK